LAQRPVDGLNILPTGLEITEKWWLQTLGLAELALHMAGSVLNQNGAFAAKLFQGEGFDAYIKEVRQQFKTVKLRKPSASRPRSREVYVVARNLI